MDLLLSEEQSLLRQSVQAFGRRLLGGAHLRRLPTSPGRFPAREFEEAAAAGWLGLLVAPEKDGSGLGLTELCLVAEELGAALSALPLVPAIGGLVALAESEAAVPAGLLAKAIGGKAMIVPALASSAAGDEQPIASSTGPGAQLSGARIAVPAASAAAGFIIPARIDSDDALIYLPRDHKGVRVDERIAIDGTVLGEVALDRVPLADVLVLARGAQAQILRRKIAVVLNFGLAAEILGLMQAATSRTLDYLRLRVQFGRPIGSFQALQHRAVNDHVAVETTRSLIYEATKLTHFDDDLEALSCAAKARAAEAAPAAIASSIQMHGAIGFTDEHDIGLMLKRALTLTATYGPAAPQRRRYAALLAGRAGPALPEIRNPDPGNEAFRQEVRAFIERTLPTDLRDIPTRAPFDRVMWWHRQLFERGWIAPRWPKAYGGMDAPLEQQIILAEELGRVGAPELSGQAINHVGPILVALGTEEQKAKHLPKMLSGETVWCQGYSEPGAGSDLASLRTAAVLDGDHFVINGQKIWTTWAHHADWMFALVRTDPAAVKQAGITFILIDMKTPGITVRPIRTIAEDNEFAEVFFDNVRVPRENVVGAVNDGWRVANALLAQERLQSSNPQKCMTALARLKKAAAASATSDPVFRDKLTAAEIEVLALAAAYEHAVALTRTGRPLGPESSFLKLAASELTQQLTALTIEARGSNGVLHETRTGNDGAVHAAIAYLQARRETIFAGSSEIQRNIIAKRVLNLP